MKTFTQILCLLVCVLVGCSTNPGKEGPRQSADSVYRGPIIDMHVHALTDNNPLLGLEHPPTLRGETYRGVTTAAEQKEETLAQMRKHNIVKAMVENGQLWLDEAPDAILVGGAFLPVDALREQHQQGQLQIIAELAPFYAGKLATDPTVMPYFQLAEELDIPVGFHILPGGPNYGFHLPIVPELMAPMRIYNADPLQLEGVIVQHPDLRIYIMHGGWPYVEDVKALMYAHPNVYVDIAVINWVLPEKELHRYLQALIDAGFGDRIMYGTDQMSWPQTFDVAIDTVNSADFLSWEQKEDIFYDNAATFLGFTQSQIDQHKARHAD